MVEKNRFDSLGDFKMTLEFHSEQKSRREIREVEETEMGVKALTPN